LNRRLGGAQSLSGHFDKKKEKSLSPTWIQTLDRRCSNYTTSALGWEVRRQNFNPSSNKNSK